MAPEPTSGPGVTSGLPVTRSWITASIEVVADERRAYTTCIENFRIRAFFLIIELLKYVASHRCSDARVEQRRPK
jgi:hypothetical protein